MDYANGEWKSSPYFKSVLKDKQGNILLNAAGIDVDGYYGYQCFDWVNGYSVSLGQGKLSGEGAADIWETAPQSFSREENPMPGDIHVYGEPYGYNGKRYLGHTGIVTGGTRASFTSIDQNWNNANLTVGSPPTAVKHNSQGLIGFLRFKGADMEAEINELQEQMKGVYSQLDRLNNEMKGVYKQLDELRASIDPEQSTTLEPGHYYVEPNK